MYRRLVTSVTVMCAVAGIAAVPVATAREVAPPLSPVSRPLPAPAQQMLTFGRGELRPVASFVGHAGYLERRRVRLERRGGRSGSRPQRRARRGGRLGDDPAAPPADRALTDRHTGSR
jgi:hypothetical protein